MHRAISLDVYDYADTLLCNLYNSENDISGQASEVVVHTERNGFKEIRFNLPSVCDDGERNYRLDYLKTDYKLRLRIIRQNIIDGIIISTDTEIDWFLISESKVTHNNFSMNYEIRASHVSQLLNTKNLNLEFSNEEGGNTGTIEQIAAVILEGTGWHLGYVPKFYEEDKYARGQKKEKVRNFEASAKTGAFKMMNDLCEMFDAKPIYHGEGKYIPDTPVSSYNPPYKKNEYCYYQGALWQSKVAIPASEAWTESHWQEAPNVLTGRTVDITPINPFSKDIEEGAVPKEVLEGESVLELHYDKNITGITRTLNTDSLVTVLSAYGSFGDENGIASLQNCEHAEVNFGNLAKGLYEFTYLDGTYYFETNRTTTGLIWSYLDFVSRTYVYNGTYLFKVTRKHPVDSEGKQRQTAVIDISNKISYVRNELSFIMDFSYYQKIGLLTDDLLLEIAKLQWNLPKQYVASQESSAALSAIETDLTNTASSGGFVKLDILNSDKRNGYVMLRLNKTSDHPDGVIFRSDYIESKRNYFSWSTSSNFNSAGQAIGGRGSVVYIVKQGNPTSWTKSYVKAYGNLTDNYYRDDLDNIYSLHNESHYDHKEPSATDPSGSKFPSTGQDGIIYVADDTKKNYIWKNNSYVEVKASNYDYGLNEFDNPDTIVLWNDSDGLWDNNCLVCLFSSDSIAGIFGPREDQVISNKQSVEESVKNGTTEVHPILFLNQNDPTPNANICESSYGWYYRSYNNRYSLGDLYFCYGKNGEVGWSKVYVTIASTYTDEIPYADTYAGYNYIYSLKRSKIYRLDGNVYKSMENGDEKIIKKHFSVVVEGCYKHEVLTKGVRDTYTYDDTFTSLKGNYAFRNEFDRFYLFSTGEFTVSDPSLVYYDTRADQRRVWLDRNSDHTVSASEYSSKYLTFPVVNELAYVTFNEEGYTDGTFKPTGKQYVSTSIGANVDAGGVHENVEYVFYLPPGSIVVCRDENNNILAEQTISPFVTPNHTKNMRVVCKTKPTSSHYLRIRDYHKKLFVKDTEYTILQCKGGGSRTGLYNLMDEFISLAHDAYEVKLPALRQSQKVVADTINHLSLSLGDMYREGFWQDNKYVEDNTNELYVDALENLKEIAQPQATYDLTYLDLYGSDNNLDASVETDWPDVDISYAAHLVDMDIDTNKWAYIDSIDKCYDQPWKTQIEINTRLSMIGQQSFTDVLAKIAEIANEVKAKQTIYGRAGVLGSAGQLAADKLEGLINANKIYLLGGTSNWYTDEKGNIIFEASDGQSVMMLTGRGLMIANAKDPQTGEWLWRTAVSGLGINADVIAAGEFSAKFITAGTITVDKLASGIGQELEIGSNKALTLYATEDGSRPAGSLLTQHPPGTDSWIQIAAADGDNPAFIDIQSGGIVNLYGGSKMNIETDGQLNLTGASMNVKSKGSMVFDAGTTLNIKTGSTGAFLVDSPNFIIKQNDQDPSQHDVTIVGNITTTGGNIAGFIIGTAGTGDTKRDYLYAGKTTSVTANANGVYLGTDGINIGGKLKFSYNGSTAELTVDANKLHLGSSSKTLQDEFDGFDDGLANANEAIGDLDDDVRANLQASIVETVRTYKTGTSESTAPKLSNDNYAKDSTWVEKIDSVDSKNKYLWSRSRFKTYDGKYTYGAAIYESELTSKIEKTKLQFMRTSSTTEPDKTDSRWQDSVPEPEKNDSGVELNPYVYVCTHITYTNGTTDRVDIHRDNGYEYMSAAGITATNIAAGIEAVPRVTSTGIDINGNTLKVQSTGQVQILGNGEVYIGTSSSNSACVMNKNGISIGSTGSIAIVSGSGKTGATIVIGNAGSAFTIGSNGTNAYIYNGRTSISQTNVNGIYMGTDGINVGKANGNHVIAKANGTIDVTGSITATSFTLNDSNFVLPNTQVQGLTNAGVVYSYQVSTSGTTVPTGTWSSTRPTSIDKGKYLWTKIVTTALNGTVTTAYNVEYYSKDGGHATEVEELYYLKKTDGYPNAPTAKITRTTDVKNYWTLTVPTWEDDYTYYRCQQITWTGRLDGKTMTWSDVYIDYGLTVANSEATSASIAAAEAASTIEPFTHDGLSYGVTWGGKQYGVVLSSKSTAKPLLIGSNAGITIAKSATSSDGAAVVIDSSGIALNGKNIVLQTSGTTTDVITMNDKGIILATGAKIQIKTGATFTVDSNKFSIDTNGNVNMEGKITSTSGKIGAWTITSTSLYKGTRIADSTGKEPGETGYVTTFDSDYVGMGHNSYAFWAGGTTSISGAPFTVTTQGALKATNATITGSITASSFTLTGNAAIPPSKVTGLTNAKVVYTYQTSTSGTTTPTGTWSSTRPTSITKGQYLWTKIFTTNLDGTTSTAYNVEYYPKDGPKGDNGKDGGYITKIEELYYLKSTSGAPAQPTEKITSSSDSKDGWRIICPTWVSGCTYYRCQQCTWTGRADGKTMTHSEVWADYGLSIANQEAKNAANTVQPFVDDGLTWGQTWGGTTYGVCLTGSSYSYPMLIGSNKGITIAKSSTSSDGAAVVINKDGIKLHASSFTVTTTKSTASATNAINMDTNGIQIYSGAKIEIKSGASFTVSSNNFSIDTSGNVEMKGKVTATSGSFTGSVTATSGSFTGSIYASSGTIGGATIGSTFLGIGLRTPPSGTTYDGKSAFHYKCGISSDSSYAFWAGVPNGGYDRDNAPFSVTPAGKIKATSGTIAGWNIGIFSNGGGFFANKATQADSTIGMAVSTSSSSYTSFWAGGTPGGSGTAPFKVTNQGVLTARQGFIGGWTMNKAWLWNNRTDGSCVCMLGSKEADSATNYQYSDARYDAVNEYLFYAGATWPDYNPNNTSVYEKAPFKICNASSDWDGGTVQSRYSCIGISYNNTSGKIAGGEEGQIWVWAYGYTENDKGEKTYGHNWVEVSVSGLPFKGGWQWGGKLSKVY